MIDRKKIRNVALFALSIGALATLLLSLDVALTSSHKVAFRSLLDSPVIRRDFGAVEQVMLVGRKWRGGLGRSACTDLTYVVFGSNHIGIVIVRLKVKSIEPWNLVAITRGSVAPSTENCWR